MWVQLQSRKSFMVKGTMTNYEPGDWVDVGRHVAQRWINSGEAVIPQVAARKLLTGSAGVVLTQGDGERLAGLAHIGVEVQTGTPQLPWLKTLVMDPEVTLQENRILAGFGLLDTWQVVAPLKPYNLLAQNLCDEAERERTLAVIPDLRVPVYDHRCVFLRRCAESRELLERWQGEGGGILAFLRALYQVKPLVLALPCLWTSRA